MKLTFLGTGSAFAYENYQSNMLLQANGEGLLIDCGADGRRAMHAQGFNHHNIDGLYISHLHNDHIGGVEWVALNTFFDPTYKKRPKLFVHEGILQSVWEAIRGGLRTLDEQEVSIETYFDVVALKSGESFECCGASFELVPVLHMVDAGREVPCNGLIWKTPSGEEVFLTSDLRLTLDTLQPFYDRASLIFHDAETTVGFKTGVHAHYEDLKELSEATRAKMWLYSYQDGPLPDAAADGFAGFVKQGQVFEW